MCPHAAARWIGVRPLQSRTRKLALCWSNASTHSSWPVTACGQKTGDVSVITDHILNDYAFQMIWWEQALSLQLIEVTSCLWAEKKNPYLYIYNMPRNISNIQSQWKMWMVKKRIVQLNWKKLTWQNKVKIRVWVFKKKLPHSTYTVCVSVCKNGKISLLLYVGLSCPTYLWLLHWLPYLAESTHNLCVHSGPTTSGGF